MPKNFSTSVQSTPLRIIKFNPWTLANTFQEAHPDLFYSPDQHCFYNYSDSKKVWLILSDSNVKTLILNWIQEANPKDYTKFPPHNTNEVLTLLQRKEFNITKIKAELHKEGFLLPFINGVLNCKTKEFIPMIKFFILHILLVLSLIQPHKLKTHQCLF